MRFGAVACTIANRSPTGTCARKNAPVPSDLVLVTTSRSCSLRVNHTWASGMGSPSASVTCPAMDAFGGLGLILSEALCADHTSRKRGRHTGESREVEHGAPVRDGKWHRPYPEFFTRFACYALRHGKDPPAQRAAEAVAGDPASGGRRGSSCDSVSVTKGAAQATARRGRTSRANRRRPALRRVASHGGLRHSAAGEGVEGRRRGRGRGHRN